jgi:hypothetical protein
VPFLRGDGGAGDGGGSGSTDGAGAGNGLAPMSGAGGDGGGELWFLWEKNGLPMIMALKLLLIVTFSVSRKMRSPQRVTIFFKTLL